MGIPTAINRLSLWDDVIITITPVWNQYGVFVNKSNASSSSIVSSAMSMANTVLTYYGNRYQLIFSQGKASSTIVNSSCFDYVSNGGILYDPEVNSRGTVNVFSGGTLSGGTFKNAAILNLNGGASACDFSADKANITAAAGISIMNIDITSCGINVQSGTLINIARINAGASMNVYSSGSASNIVAKSAARISCYNDGTIENVSCQNGASIYVYSATARNLNVDSGVMIYTSQGTKIEDMNLADGAFCQFNAFGFDEETKLTGSNANGSFYVSNGTAYNMELGQSMNCMVTYGASAYNIRTKGNNAGIQIQYGAVASGLYLSGSYNSINTESAVVIEDVEMHADRCSVYCAESVTANDIRISGNSCYVGISSGAVASGINASGSNNYVSIGPNGTAIGIVLSGGSYNSTVISGSTIDTVVYSGGQEYVADNGSSINATIKSGGTIFMRYAAKADLTTVESGGIFYVSSAYGSATNLTLQTGAYMNEPYSMFRNSNFVCSLDSAKAMTLSAGYVMDIGNVLSGIVSSYNSQWILPDGSSIETTLNQSAEQWNSNGTVESTTIGREANQSNCGTQAIAIHTIISGYQSNISCFVSDTNIQSGGYQYNSDATAIDTLISGSQANNSGSAFNNSLFANARLYASNRCIVSNTIIAGQSAFVSVTDNASAIHTQIQDSTARMAIAYSGYGNDIDVSCGFLNISGYSAFGENINISSGGSLYLYEYASANAVDLDSGAIMTLTGSSFVSDVTIKTGARMTLGWRTIADGIYISTGGSLYVSSAASALRVTSAEGAIVNVEYGGYIEYVTE